MVANHLKSRTRQLPHSSLASFASLRLRIRHRSVDGSAVIDDRALPLVARSVVSSRLIHAPSSVSTDIVVVRVAHSLVHDRVRHCASYGQLNSCFQWSVRSWSLLIVVSWLPSVVLEHKFTLHGLCNRLVRCVLPFVLADPVLHDRLSHVSLAHSLGRVARSPHVIGSSVGRWWCMSVCAFAASQN